MKLRSKVIALRGRNKKDKTISRAKVIPVSILVLFTSSSYQS